jgi:hypothetical protein
MVMYRDLGLDSIPQQVVRSWIPMLSIGTVRADVTGRLVNEGMPFQLILPLETRSILAMSTVFDRAVVGSLFRMNNGVRAVDLSVLCDMARAKSRYLSRY